MADGGFLGLIGNFVSGAAGKAWSPQTGFAAAAASPPPAFGGGANVPPPISQTRSAYD